MSDNPESAGHEERKPQPSGDASQKPGQSPSGGRDVDALVKAILEHPDFQKSTQSVKDKRIAEIQTNLNEQGSELARIAEALGHTPEELRKAQKQIAMEDLVDAYSSGNLPPIGRVSDHKAPGSDLDLTDAARSILEKAGLATAPAGFDDYLASLDWSDPIDAALSASAWVREAGTNQPSDADIAPPEGAPSPGGYAGMTTDELALELSKLQRDPRKNAAKREEINAILAKRRAQNT